MPGVLTVAHRLTAANGTAPEWVELMPGGVFHTADGRATLRMTAPQAVIGASLARGAILVDENHATQFASALGKAAPAVGWIGTMEVRGGNIWGGVDWTPDGRRLVASRTYSDISVAVEPDASGAVCRILYAGLVNAPHLVNCVSLHTSNASDPTERGRPMSEFGREIDGSKDIKPTSAERETARVMGIDPHALARQRYKRANPEVPPLSAQDQDIFRRMGVDGQRIMKARVGTLTRNSTQNFPDLTAAELKKCREAGIDAEGFVSETKAQALQNGGLFNLTDQQRLVCQTMGIDADEYLAWLKRKSNRVNDYSSWRKAMNLQPSVTAALRTHLVRIDSLDQRLDGLAAPIQAARAAADRLRGQIAGLDQQIAAPAIRPIPTDAQRLEALIAGSDVPQIDKTGIEAKAARNRSLAADRQQITIDLGAVEGHFGQLNAQVAELRQQKAIAERKFIEALAGALSEAYQRDAIEFIDTHVPELLSVAAKVAELTGTLPPWQSWVMSALSVGWPDVDYVPPVNSGFRRVVNVWPRADNTLLSGEPASSPEVVERLIAAIRATPATGATVEQPVAPTASAPGERAATNR